MRLRTPIIAATLLVLLAFVAWPHAAHAETPSLLDVFTDPVASIASIIVSLLQVIQSALASFVLWLVKILTTVLLQPGLNYGGVAVYTVWKVFRDLCNSFFLVFFILIAFSTIFHSVWKGGAAYYYRSALLNVIVAAVLVNFSLPIGQTMVWAGNQATLAVMGLMQGTNIEARLTAALSLEARAKPISPTQSIYAVPDITKPLSQQNEALRVITEQWTPAQQAEYEKCNEENLRPQASGGCIAYVMGIHYDPATMALDAAAKTATPKSQKWYGVAWTGLKAFVGGCIRGGTLGCAVIGGANAGIAVGESLSTLQKQDTAQLLAKMGIAIGNIVLLILMSISFLCVIAFMVIRLPMIWFLLASSAVACFFYAVPKSNRAQAWFGDMIGYNIFGPLYLFAIYIGLLVLTLQSTLLVGLKNAQWYEGILGAFLFTGIATAIFTGGAAAAWKFAFSFSSDLKERVTKYGAAVGVSEKSMFGLSGMADKSGLTARYEARKAQLGQFGGDVRATIQGRAPSLFRSKEESVAYRKMKLGVRGADAELDKLTAKRIGGQKDVLEAQGLDTAGLQKAFRSGNKDVAMAAGELLLKKGALSTPQERDRLLSMYGNVSPVARKEAQKRITEQLQKQAGREWEGYKDLAGDFDFSKFLATAKQSGKSEDVRKFLEAAMRGEVGQRAQLDAGQLNQMANLMNNPEDQRAFFEAASKSGRNKVAAIETMANLGLITDRNGNRVAASDAITERASALSDNDLLDAEDFFMNAGGALPPALQEKMRESMKKPGKFGQLLKNVSGPEQQLRILDQFADVKSVSAAAKRDVRVIESKDRKYAEGVKRLRQKQKKLTGAQKKRVENWIEKLEEKRSDMKDELRQLRKNIS